LEADHVQLRALIDALAPALKARLSPQPAQPTPFGYQLLPTMSADVPPSGPPPRPSSAVYSWPWTRQMIEMRETKRVDLRARIARAHNLAEPARGKEIEALIDLYKELDGGQHLIDAHVKYNHFWQQEIANDRPRYDRQTALHDEVLALAELRDKLARQENASDRAREKELSRDIHEAAYGHVLTPAFVAGSVIEPAPGHSVRQRRLQLPVYTDIEDAAYLEHLRQAVMAKWHVTDSDEDDVLDIVFRPLAPSTVESPPPARGAHLDVAAHLARFPLDGAVLTTGASSTYAMPGRAVVLGPLELSPNTLAHEFGHLLGFIDGYFRGYRDRGANGFDVLEIVPDATDIICAPGAGQVKKSHYDALFEALGTRVTVVREPSKAPGSTDVRRD
jgi:hypothetical protein